MTVSVREKSCTFLHGKILNRPKQMNAVSTKVLLRFFPPVCPFAALYFHLVMPRHVLSPCYARCEHTRRVKGGMQHIT
jgi:hypothetical protein